MEKQLLVKALDNNDLIGYLEGKDVYKKTLHYWVGSNVPTDWTQIIPKGIYKLFCERPELKLDILFEEALMKMMDGSNFDLYVALSVIFVQLIREERNASPFIINREKILSKLKVKLFENETALKQYFEWEGKNQEEGMWSEVIRINSLCEQKWRISILGNQSFLL